MGMAMIQYNRQRSGILMRSPSSRQRTCTLSSQAIGAAFDSCVVRYRQSTRTYEIEVVSVPDPGREAGVRLSAGVEAVDV